MAESNFRMEGSRKNVIWWGLKQGSLKVHLMKGLWKQPLTNLQPHI